MKLSCKVIEDLLPMYYDKVCSDETTALVEAHLKDCPDCSRILSDLRGEIEIPAEKPDDIKPLKKLQKSYKKMKLRWLIAVILIVALIPVAFLIGNRQEKISGEFDKNAAIAIGNAFMETLQNGDYEKILTQLDTTKMQEKHREWLKDSRFGTDDLQKIEALVLHEFIKACEPIEAAGGIKGYKCIDAYMHPMVTGQEKIGTVVYSVRINGREERLAIYVTENGLWQIGDSTVGVDGPLSQLFCWAMWVYYYDNISRKYDNNLNDYVFYPKNLMTPEEYFSQFS